MVHEARGMHHFHKRKRVYQNLEPYPHPNRLKNFLDRFVYVVALFGVVMTLPQVMKIWVEHSTAGVSILSWAAYVFVAAFWTFYGIVHKERPIIFTSGSLMILNAAIVIGILLYG